VANIFEPGRERGDGLHVSRVAAADALDGYGGGRPDPNLT